MSYLGKISAIVSANTGDYVRKLNDSARTTQSFAKTIQGDLNKAATDARRAIDSVLTPLQRFERAIQNASGFKLKFRGVDVAVQNVRDLAVLVSKLERKRDIDFAVRASGMKNITELKAALTAISQDSMDIVGRVGVAGLEKARAELDSIREENGRKVIVTLDARKAAEYDAAIAAYRQLGGEKKVSLLISAVGADQLNQAVLKEKQLVSIAAEISTPLAAATRKYEQMGLAIQAALGPALKMAQESQDKLTTAVEMGARITRTEYEAARRSVELTADAIERVAEAEAMVARLGTGKSLQLASPIQYDVLSRADALRQRRENLTGAATMGFGIGGQEAAVLKEAEYLSRLMASRASLVRKNQSTAAIDSVIDRQTQKLVSQIDVYQRLIVAAEAYQRQQAAAQQATALGTALGATSNVAFGQAVERRRRAQGVMGIGPQSATDIPRELDTVGSRINALRGQIDSLPSGLRGQMIPALRAIQNEFVGAATRGRATATEIQRMEQGLQRAEAQAKRFATASSLVGARDAIGGIRTNEATGRLAAMQRVLVQVGATASGPVARAYERFLTATQRAIRENTIGLPRIKRQLDGLAEGVARAASQTGRISFDKANREIQRGGDVGRMGFDKFSLGIQQAGFAVDDFFSSVGGWDQKIRAISNNITQMAFIMGGTYGLGAGLAFVIGSQIALAVNKFVFKSREAEAAASAMNKALDNQKDRVKELADSYRTLAVEISKSGMTKEGARRFEQQQASRDRRKEGNEVAIEIAAGRSPRLAAARGMVEFERKNRSEATNVRDVLRAAARERAAEVVVRRREEAMLAKARATAGGSSYDQIRADQIRNKERLDRAQKIDDNDVLGGIWWVTEPRRAARRRRIAAMQEKDAALEAAASLRRQQKGEELLAAGGGVESRLAPITQRLDEIGFTRAGQRINKLFQSIASAMEDFQAGRMTEESLKAFIDSLGATASAAEAAAQPVLAFAETVKRLGSDAVRAGAETARSKEEELRRDANSAVGSSQRGTDLMRSQARSRADEARAGEQQIAAARREAEAGLYQIRQEQAAMQARFEADIAAGGGPAEAVDISRRIAAQNAILTNPNSSPELQEQTRLYIERLQERLRQIIEAMPESQELRARADGLLAGLDGVISAVEESMRRAEEMAAFDREVANRRNPVGNAMRGLDLAESPRQRAVREARQGMADIGAAFDEQFRELADRNNGLPFAGQGAEAARLRAERQSAFNNFAQEQLRSAAPAIFEMADAVQNAILQGPSRQALEMTDVSTMEGSRELNRLLRGDDASKNANIVELEKQNQKLTELVNVMRPIAAGMGIVLDL